MSESRPKIELESTDPSRFLALRKRRFSLLTRRVASGPYLLDFETETFGIAAETMKTPGNRQEMQKAESDNSRPFALTSVSASFVANV